MQLMPSSDLEHRLGAMSKEKQDNSSTAPISMSVRHGSKLITYVNSATTPGGRCTTIILFYRCGTEAQQG